MDNCISDVRLLYGVDLPIGTRSEVRLKGKTIGGERWMERIRAATNEKNRCREWRKQCPMEM